MASTFKIATAGALLAKIDAGTLTLDRIMTVMAAIAICGGLTYAEMGAMLSAIGRPDGIARRASDCPRSAGLFVLERGQGR